MAFKTLSSLLLPLLTFCNDEIDIDNIQFDENDPIVSHPDMQDLVRSLVSKRRRQGLDAYSSNWDAGDQQLLTDMHNKVRSELARGEVKGQGYGNLPSACNMIELKWSEALEKLATDYTKKIRCTMRHNLDRQQQLLDMYNNPSDNRLFEFELTDNNVGENLYWAGFSGQSLTDDKVWNSVNSGIYDKWSIEEALRYYYGGPIEIFDGAKVNGHFTQVIWAETEYVGCGFCSSPSCGCQPGRVLFTCNYWPTGNGRGYPYQAGTQCSCCPDGKEYCTTGDNAGLCTDVSPNDDDDGYADCIKLSGVYGIFDLSYAKTKEVHNGKPVYLGLFSIGFDPWEFYIVRNKEDTEWVLGAKDDNPLLDGYKPYTFCSKVDLLSCGWDYGWATKPGKTTVNDQCGHILDNSAFEGYGDEDENDDDSGALNTTSIVLIIVFGLLCIGAINAVFCCKMYKKEKENFNKSMDRVMDNDVEMETAPVTTTQ